jgi:hypothetical protein
LITCLGDKNIFLMIKDHMIARALTINCNVG